MEKPPSSKRDPDDLAEVERALSVLKGRHPEHERLSREDAARLAARKAELDRVAQEEERAVRAKRFKLGVVLVAGTIILGILAAVFRSEVARRSRVDEITAPFRAMGFSVIDISSRRAPGALESSVDPGCLLAVSTSSAALKVSVGGSKVEGDGPVLFCTCQDEKVTVETPMPDTSGSVALLRADASRIGGSRAFAFAPLEPKTTAKTDGPCADASFDAWLEAGNYPKATPDQASVPAGLESSSFASLAVLKSGSPFVVVELPAESCTIALSETPSDALALRFKGAPGHALEGAGSVAWCASAASLAVIEREGKGDVAVVAAPAAKVGGLLGLREIARDANVDLDRAGTPARDRGWDARATLVASAVPEALVNTATAPTIAPDVESRIFVLSVGKPSALVPDTPPDTYSFCEPMLGTQTTESLCAFSGPVTWRAAPEAMGGVARAKLPFWLFALQGVDDPAALKVATQLASLARKLKREGFEPTTLEAVTELPKGVEVLGRTGEDAVVAVMLSSTAPYAFPLGDTRRWALGEPPVVVDVQPLSKVVLTSSERKIPPPASRRTVVFRRKAAR